MSTPRPDFTRYDAAAELPAGSTPAVLARMLEDALSLLEEDGLAARACLAQAVLLLRSSEACGARPVRPPSGQALAPWQVRKIAEYVGANLASPIRTGELAALTRLTTGHFTRLFRGSFGVTPQAYILHRRMERAQALMRQTNQPLSHIALETGHCDQAHFSRVFRRLHGLAPGVWRRQRRLG